MGKTLIQDSRRVRVSGKLAQGADCDDCCGDVDCSPIPDPSADDCDNCTASTVLGGYLGKYNDIITPTCCQVCDQNLSTVDSFIMNSTLTDLFDDVLTTLNQLGTLGATTACMFNDNLGDNDDHRDTREGDACGDFSSTATSNLALRMEIRATEVSFVMIGTGTFACIEAGPVLVTYRTLLFRGTAAIPADCGIDTVITITNSLVIGDCGTKTTYTPLVGPVEDLYIGGYGGTFKFCGATF